MATAGAVLALPFIYAPDLDPSRLPAGCDVIHGRRRLAVGEHGPNLIHVYR